MTLRRPMEWLIWQHFKSMKFDHYDLPESPQAAREHRSVTTKRE